ncbi:polyglutamate synthase [Caballeronia novacaledonica]|uniref:Polyglutamate synthase n=1 Tax=Caballeronia novacaledonica TaxID=1544861 RepID=A0A2U3I3W8_9BURK|nr:CapA family protein [Caballeronia novacaledonica]SPB14814.1 polyglutamate synthase [Caballeronia novacaledonica]
MSDTSTVVIAGDCGPTHGPAEGYPIEGYTELVQPVLEKANFRFVNCMRTYSTRGVKSDHAPQVCQPVEMSKLFTGGLFDAVTMSNNHSYDAGPDALVDTRDLLMESGVQVTGAGRNLAEARQPAIVERNGVRVGYLGYTSVGAAGSDAGPQKPGVTNVRVKTTYETRGPHQPVRVHTEPNADDLRRLIEDVTALRSQADVVILAFHSGVIRLPRVISDYQVTVAHAAIDAGADMVVCHAPHIPKAIEVYKGKVVFYSLGVFAMTKSFAAPSWTNEPAWAHGAVRNHTDLDPTYPLMPYGKDCTLGLLAKAEVSKNGIGRVSFLPMTFDERYRPQVLLRDDKRFDDFVAYMEWVSEDMPHRFEVVGDEVLITG